MTLSPEIRHIVISHTANMNPLERAIRAKQLCKLYKITDENDQREIARLAAVREEEVIDHA
jgi:hypothetical protein